MHKNLLYDSRLQSRNFIFPSVHNYFYDKENTLAAMAMEAYIYGYPLVLTAITKKSMLSAGLRMNQFINERTFPTPRYTTIVRPNVDTLYSMAWLDLSEEPVILQVPDTRGTYYLMELLDAWTNVFASIGARTTGTGAGNFAIAGPQWNGRLPAGVTRIDAPGNTVWIIGRTQTDGTPDYAAVHAIQDQYALIPLSDWGHSTGSVKNNTLTTPGSLQPAAQVAALTAAAFFQLMMQAMENDPPWITDPAMNHKLAALGLVPGAYFNLYDLNPAVIEALEFSTGYGPKAIDAGGLKNTNQPVNGWNLLTRDVGFYGADYLQRAFIAKIGIGANLPQDAVYGSAFTDSDGVPLTGRHHYVLSFSKKQLPPVNAFWSVTLYNDQGFLAANPLDRYAVSPHLGNLKYNTDGSLDIFIGSASPGTKQAANWLPAPDDSFNLILRMYWPGWPVLTGQWPPPVIIRM